MNYEKCSKHCLLKELIKCILHLYFNYRNNSPNSLELKAIEVWIISCTLFVFFALIEYFVVLFGMRYDKHWRHPKKEFDSQLNMHSNKNRLGYNGDHRIAPLDDSVVIQDKEITTPVTLTDALNKVSKFKIQK